MGPTADDEMMLQYLSAAELPFLVVATKADKLNKTEREKALARLASHPDIPTDTPIIPFSSLKGEGKDEVWRAIKRYAAL